MKHKKDSLEKSKKRDKNKKKKRKRHYSDSSSSTSSSSSSEDKRIKKELRKKPKVKETERKKTKINVKEVKESEEECFDVPLSLMNTQSMAPMTKEEWDKKQNTTKRVFDESTGRYRLIKGDGEVIEEIVSKDRHKEINKLATKGDGDYFQSQILK